MTSATHKGPPGLFTPHNEAKCRSSAEIFGDAIQNAREVAARRTMAAKKLRDFAWHSTTAKRYDEMLNVLELSTRRVRPPVPGSTASSGTSGRLKSGMFLVSEAMCHDDNGVPCYTVYSRADGKYTVGSRPITVAEFNTLLGLESPC